MSSYPKKGECRNTGRTRFKKGQISPNKGNHYKIKDTSKMHHTSWCKGMKGKGICKPNSGSFKKGNINWCKGKKRPDITGKNHFNWKNGATPENAKIRNSMEFDLWRIAVFARDNWTCQKTGIKGGKLTPHHIQNFAQWPELRLAIDNGITLSKEAHREFHHRYGVKNNTREQLEEFIKGTKDD